MIAVNEGNSECLRCGHFSLTLGCVLCYQGEVPKCGRNIILTQKEYRSLLLKNVKIAELVELCINGKISCENLLKSRDISQDKISIKNYQSGKNRHDMLFEINSMLSI